MNRSEELGFMDIFLIIRANIYKLIIAGIIGGLLMGVFTYFFVDDKYTASMRMVVNNKSNDIITLSEVQVSSRIVGDCMEMIKSRDLMEDIIEALGIYDMSATQLINSISVSSPDETRILNVSVTDTNPVRAKLIADEIFIQGSRLMEQKLDVNSVEIFETPIVPESPSSPNLKSNILVGGLAGVLIVFAILFVLKITNTKLYSSAEVEHELGLSVLASIPKADDASSQSKKNKRRIKRKKENA